MRSALTTSRKSLTVIFVAVLMSVALVGCGGDDSAQTAATEARIERERKDAADQARLEEKVKRLEAEAKKAKKNAAQSSSSTEAQASSPASSNSTGSWPADTSAWTVILTSASTRQEASTVASRARGAGLGQVGLLYSNDHSSLRPGYWVAYTGILDKSGATGRQSSARSAGFGDAYARYVSAN